MNLAVIFEIAADAFESGDARFEEVLAEAAEAATWYWVLAPERGKPKQPLLLGPGPPRPRGPAFLETGFVWAPYVPLVVTSVLKATRLREDWRQYSQRVLRPEFYGRITIPE